MKDPRKIHEDTALNGITRNTSIDEVGLTGRARNTLSRRGIQTMGDLESLFSDSQVILSWTGVGRSVFDEIMALEDTVKALCLQGEQEIREGSGTWKQVILDRRILRETGRLSIPEAMFNSRAMTKIERCGLNDLLRYQTLSQGELMGKANLDARNAEKVVRELKPISILLNLTTLSAPSTGKSGYILSVGEKMEMAFAELPLRQIPQEIADFKAVQTEGGVPEGKLPSAVRYYDGGLLEGHRRAVKELSDTFAVLGIYLQEEMQRAMMGRILCLPGMGTPFTELDEGRYRLLAETFMSGPVIRSALADKIHEDLCAHKAGYQVSELEKKYPRYLQGTLFEGAVKQLVRDKHAVLQGDWICANGKSVKEWIRDYPNPNKRKIIEMRLNGGTLDEIGTEVHLTRERVRQIVDVALNSENFKEDQYAGLYQRYNFDQEQARMAFGKVEGNYLSLIFDRGDRELEEALEGESLPENLRLHIETALERDYILDHGNLVKRQANEVKNYLIRTYCREQTTVEEYIGIYRDFCAKYDPHHVLRQLDEQSISNKLHDSYLTVTTYGKKFRYYPIATMDFTDLIEGLHLRDFTDIEYSTLYFFRNYPEVMEQYDIRDACELHNLLKKVVTPEIVPDLVFGRMPILKFGHSDRNAQVESMLMDYAPEISNQDLARMYEERYGVASATFIANYCGCISQYFFGGMYKLDAELLPEDQVEHMKKLLTKEFYLTDDFRKLYMQEFPGASGSEIMPITIRQLGFKPYQGYVVSTKYHSATDYIEHLLLGKEETDMSKFPPKLTIQHLFSRIYMLYKQQYEILEVSPGKLRRLSYFEKKGIKKADFERYVDHVINFPVEEEFFSIHSLRAAGFKDPLDKLHMSDWFYATLLQQRMDAFSLQRIGGVKILRRGRRPFNASTVIEQTIHEHGPMSMDEMLGFLNKKHDIDIDRKRMFLLVSGGNLYYDRLTKKIYEAGEDVEKMLQERQSRIAQEEENE